MIAYQKLKEKTVLLLITSELANQRARKVLFTCVVYTNAVYNMSNKIANHSGLCLCCQ